MHASCLAFPVLRKNSHRLESTLCESSLRGVLEVGGLSEILDQSVGAMCRTVKHCIPNTWD